METQNDLDLGLLAAFSLNTGHHREALQELVDGLFSLPRTDDAFTVQLPAPKHVLPRMHPLPKEKVETRWEKFAREKGIDKRKKERMVWDEHSQSWKPSFGYGRAVGTGNNEAPIMELKSTDADDVDPFERARDGRKMKQLKQKKHELANQERKQHARVKTTELLAASDTRLKGKLESNKKTLKAVQTSTRSYGRFDEKVRNEPERKIEDKRRKFAPNIADAASEKERALKILKRMAGA
jgi:regulator of ribosome biosynthesis